MKKNPMVRGGEDIGLAVGFGDDMPLMMINVTERYTGPMISKAFQKLREKRSSTLLKQAGALFITVLFVVGQIVYICKVMTVF